jgi:hypothetical protein
LVERRIDEVGELNFRDRPQPLHRHADRDTHDRRLGERRIDDAVGPELFEKPLGNEKDIAADADVLAQDQGPFVGAQRRLQRRPHGFDVVHHCHGSNAPAYTCV